jgi:hypothetical protein
MLLRAWYQRQSSKLDQYQWLGTANGFGCACVHWGKRATTRLLWTEKKVSDTEVDRKKKFQTLQSVLVRSNCEKVKVKNVK